jgi:tellurite resistance-related uncharacterized protein
MPLPAVPSMQSRSSDQNVPSLSFHCFENPTVLHVIQLRSSDQNVPLSFHCFENPTVLHAIQSWSSDQNVSLSFHYFENPTVLHVIQMTELFSCQLHILSPVTKTGQYLKIIQYLSHLFSSEVQLHTLTVCRIIHINMSALYAIKTVFSLWCKRLGVIPRDDLSWTDDVDYVTKKIIIIIINSWVN